MFEIFSRVQQDILTRQAPTSSHVLMATSDVMVGPKLLACLSEDLPLQPADPADHLHHALTANCYASLLSTGHASFLFQLAGIHGPADFSGLYLWRRGFSAFSPSLVSAVNAYKCHYKSEVLASHSPKSFSDSFCVYGLEINASDVPSLESVLSADGYFAQLLRHRLYGHSAALAYTSTRTPPIPSLVHLIWFADAPRALKLIEYLSLISIARVLKPDAIRIHGDTLPTGRLWQSALRASGGRIQWVDKQREPFKYGQDLSDAPVQHLADVARLEVMYAEGGIYSDWDVLWVKPVDELRYTSAEVVAANDIASYCSEFPSQYLN